MACSYLKLKNKDAVETGYFATIGWGRAVWCKPCCGFESQKRSPGPNRLLLFIIRRWRK